MRSKSLTPQRRSRIEIVLYVFILLAFFEFGPINCITCAYAAKEDVSDIDLDGDTDIDDIAMFSNKCLKKQWDAVDWCLWIQNGGHMDKDNKDKCDQYLEALYDFIVEYFACDSAPQREPAQLVTSRRDYPTRMKFGDDGILYVCDRQVNQVVMFEVIAEINEDPDTGLETISNVRLEEIGRISGLDQPLGIAVDRQGNIYVGNAGKHNVEVYSPDGLLLQTIGDGEIEMPNDMDFDLAGNLYVVDSKWNMVRVYGPAGEQIRTISDGKLKHPSSVEVAYRSLLDKEEVFIADKGNYVVKVFETDGSYVRKFGRRVGSSMFGGAKWKGRFENIQAMEMDSQERLHVLDCYVNTVQILNPDVPGGSGLSIFYNSYGWRGTEPGMLKTPLDVTLIEVFGTSAVSNYGNQRIELISLP